MTTTTQYPSFITPRTEPLDPGEKQSRQEISNFLIEFAALHGEPLSEQSIEFLDRHAQGECDIDSELLSVHLWKKKKQAGAHGPLSE